MGAPLLGQQLFSDDGWHRADQHHQLHCRKCTTEQGCGVGTRANWTQQVPSLKEQFHLSQRLLPLEEYWHGVFQEKMEKPDFPHFLGYQLCNFFKTMLFGHNLVNLWTKPSREVTHFTATLVKAGSHYERALAIICNYL